MPLLFARPAVLGAFSLAFAGAGLAAGAQTMSAPMTQAEMPHAGDRFRVRFAPMAGFAPLTNTGAAQTWDYSALLSDSANQVVSFKPSASTPYPSYYPGAIGTLIADTLEPQVSQLTKVYAFTELSASAYRTVGLAFTYAGTTDVKGEYTIPDTLFDLPLAFGDAATHDFAAGWSVNPQEDTRSAGTRTQQVDGWGTLITNTGSFDVLRVRSDVTRRDSAFFNGTNVYAGINKTREIMYLAKGYRLPILQIAIFDPNGINAVLGVQYVDSAYNLNQAASSVDVRGLGVWATEGGVALDWKGGTGSVSVCDAMGRVLYQGALRVEAGVQTLPVQARGLVVVRVQTGAGAWVGKAVRP